ncbi:MAG: hypothetical protein A2X17_00425 [Bacteroidetes bacterium GWF2_41_61]|nr:MAG: hypothetical protein A2X17_00425 [Bacteroidetes bacterium GWF2_41_61]
MNFIQNHLKLPDGKKGVKSIFIAILIIWFLINLIQSVTTDVIRDEAYYHFYSQNLSWGYFDHPPAVALMIKISSLLFNNELSIRFITLLLQIITLSLIWKIIEDKNASKSDVLSFFGISAAVVMFVVYGFITTPDSPLLLFTALFLLSYKRFLEKDGFVNCLLLTISMAALIYSKYQGGLIILLVIISNPKLLLNYRFWLSGIAALLLLAPHIFWQLDNDFPSLKYHTTGRSKPFKIGYFLEYLPNQLANFNPFILGVISYIIFKFKPEGDFRRGLYFIIVGMILFFWGTTFRGHVEPQWTIAASIPMIILIYEFSRKSLKIQKYLRGFVYPSIILLLIFRVILTQDSLPIKLEFYNQQRWAQELKEIVGDRAVIFSDGYQRPSVYKFYAKSDAFTVNSIYYRQNQYDLYEYKNNFFDRDIAIVTDRYDSLSQAFPILDKDTIWLRFSNYLVLTSDIDIIFKIPKHSIFSQSKEYVSKISLVNKNERDIPFNDKNFPVSLHLVLIEKGKKYSVQAFFDKEITGIKNRESINCTIKFSIPEDIPSGTYNMLFSLKTEPFREGFNSKSEKVLIERR